MEQQPRHPRFGSPTVARAAASAPPGHDRPLAVVDPGVPGTVLGGRYRVGECLGAGAMGVVWTAYDRRLRRTVAVKQLAHRDRGTDDPAAARLARTRALREGRIAARVVHPRAIAVFDVVEHDGTTWLVMEYLPSRSLATVLAEQGPLEPEVVAHLGAQIADALAAVHEAGIVHGDVKPGNVLITADGVAKITDFGVSRAVWDATATAGGAVAGTPGYFAPEVARGGEPTFASHVFSLGATLYAAVENELVCGRLDNTLAVLHAIAEAHLRPATRAGVLGRPLAAMLRRRPEHRPDPAAVRRALRARATTAPVRVVTRGDDVGPPTAPDAADVPASSSAPVGPVTGWSAPPGGADQPVTAGSVVEVVEMAEVAVPAPRRPAPSTAPPGLAEPVHAEPVASGGAGRSRRRRAAFAVLAAASVAVLGGASGVALASLEGEPEPAPAIAAPAEPGPGGPPPLAPTPSAPADGAAPPGQAPSATADVDAAIGDDEAARVVTGYYGALPADPDAAWALLSGPARDDSGGYAGYRRFWDGIREVRLADLETRAGSVSADVEFVTDEGRSSREPYRFELARDDDGRVVIVSAQRAADAM